MFGESDVPLTAVAAFTSPLALVLGSVAAGELLGFTFEGSASSRSFGAGLLALAGLFGGLGAAVFRAPRLTALSRLHWGLALPVLWAGEAALIDSGGWIVVAWAATAAVLAWLSYAASERGFPARLGADPRDRPARRLHGVHAAESPLGRDSASGDGIWVLLACSGGGIAVAAFETRFRRLAVWLTATLAVYAFSLVILEVAEDAFGSSVATNFQRGHTAVSAFWCLLGLGLLYAGLRRGSTAFRAAGFALFGVSLVKIFRYDLAQLSSVTRALSFLGVGAVLLAAAFFYQRLSVENHDGAHA